MDKHKKSPKKQNQDDINSLFPKARPVVGPQALLSARQPPRVPWLGWTGVSGVPKSWGFIGGSKRWMFLVLLLLLFCVFVLFIFFLPMLCCLFFFFFWGVHQLLRFCCLWFEVAYLRLKLCLHGMVKKTNQVQKKSHLAGN